MQFFGKPRVEGCLSFPPHVAAVDHLCLFVSFHIGDRWDKAQLSGKINWFSKQVHPLLKGSPHVPNEQQKAPFEVAGIFFLLLLQEKVGMSNILVWRVVYP